MMRQPDVRRGIPLALCAGTLLGSVSIGAVFVVGRDDERRSLAWEAAER